MKQTPELNLIADQIRRSLPARAPATNLEVHEETGVIQFTWQNKRLAVDRRLRVFEVKGKRLFVTGVSMLMQSALTRKDKNRKVIEAVVGVLREAEDVIELNQRIETGLGLLNCVQDTLKTLLLKQGSGRPAKRAKKEAAALK